MLQSATSSELATFPSTAEDPFRSLQSTIATDVEEIAGRTFVGIEADLRLADGHSIAGFYLAASGFIEDPHLLVEIDSVKADLEAFKNAVDLWYDDTVTTLIEAQRSIHAVNAQAA
jgi:hypothetical protein